MPIQVDTILLDIFKAPATLHTSQCQTDSADSLSPIHTTNYPTTLTKHTTMQGTHTTHTHTHSHTCKLTCRAHLSPQQKYKLWYSWDTCHRLAGCATFGKQFVLSVYWYYKCGAQSDTQDGTLKLSKCTRTVWLLSTQIWMKGSVVL